MLITLTPFVPCSAGFRSYPFRGYFLIKYGLGSPPTLFPGDFGHQSSPHQSQESPLQGLNSSYVSELPEFRVPDVRYVARDVWEKTWGFVKRAGTVIFFCSVIIWVLLSFSWRFEYGVPIDKSILASIGNLLSWFFYPILGEFSWGATVSAIQGLVAKEQVVSSMSIIAGFSGDVNRELIFAKDGIFGFFTPASAYAFMAFNIFSAPCLAAISAMNKEFGSTKKTLRAVAYQTWLAW